jgi:hypothetical protein
MPTSRSRSRNTEPKPPPRRRWPWVLLGLAGLLVVLGASVFVLPASIIARFLPPQAKAEDFSGSLIHGAAGTIRVNGRDAGAIEWQLHPLALLRADLVADIHWVKVSFVIDGTAELDAKGFAAHDVHGGGPLENLRDIGLGAGWRGTCTLSLAEIKSDFSKLQSAVGSLQVANLASASIAGGADLGGYTLQLANGAVTQDGSINAGLNDTGGPVEVQAQIQFSPAARTGTLSGTLKARSDASPELRHQLDNLAQVRPRDAQGRFPVDLEFTF